MKKNLLIFIFVSISFSAFCQYDFKALTSGTTEPLYGVHFINNTTGWVVGVNNTVLKTTDAGVSWNPVTIDVESRHYFDVQFIGSSVGFIASSSGYIFRTMDGGATWTKSPQIVGWCATESIQERISIQFTDANNGWVKAWGGFAKITKFDDASKWTITQIVNGSFARGLSMSTDMKGWIVGNKNGTINASYTSDAGATWSNSQICGDLNLEDVYFTSADTGYACGYRKIWKTVDAGATWVEQSMSGWDTRYAIHMINSSTGFCAGQAGTVHVIKNAGASIVKYNSESTETLMDIHAINSDFAVAVGYQGVIVMHNGQGSSVPENIYDSSDFNIFYKNKNVVVETENIFEDVVIEIYSIDGKRINSIKTNQDKNEINVSDFSSGLYILNISNLSGKKLYMKKLIIN